MAATANANANAPSNGSPGRPSPQIQPCRYKVGKTLGAGSYSVVKECVHIDTERYYAAKVINKRLMAGREHMVRLFFFPFASRAITAPSLSKLNEAQTNYSDIQRFVMRSLS